jgi:hypothetical protein
LSDPGFIPPREQHYHLSFISALVRRFIMPMKRRPHDPPLLSTFSRFDAERDIECHCLDCNRFAYWRAIELLDNIGRDLPVMWVAKHLRCKGCGSRWCEARPDFAVRGFVDGRPVM